MTVEKYRKKPVVIEAIQMPDANWWQAYRAGHTVDHRRLLDLGAFIGDALCAESVNGIVLNSNTGQVVASPGDWIIKGVEGEFYPCPDSVFQATYELADLDKMVKEALE